MTAATQTFDQTAARRRRAARQAAVQALYQIGESGAAPREVVDQFVAYRLVEGGEEGTIANADPAFFAELVEGAARRRVELDAIITSALAKGWTLARLERVARAILEVALFELVERRDVPAAVVIDEYVNIAIDYFDDPLPGFINSLLDRQARVLRPGELADRRRAENG